MHCAACACLADRANEAVGLSTLRDVVVEACCADRMDLSDACPRVIGVPPRVNFPGSRPSNVFVATRYIVIYRVTIYRHIVRDNIATITIRAGCLSGDIS